MDLNLIMCQPALVLIFRYRYVLNKPDHFGVAGVAYAPIAPPTPGYGPAGGLQLSSRFHYAQIF